MQRWLESSVSKNQVEQNSLHGLDQINIQWSHWFCRDSCQVKDESRFLVVIVRSSWLLAWIAVESLRLGERDKRKFHQTKFK